MEVGNTVDFQVPINHAFVWIVSHSSGAHLVETLRCLSQKTVAMRCLRIPVFQPAYGISAQGCIQNLVGTGHATRIAFGEAEVDGDARQSEAINFIGQDNAAVGIRFLLSMVVEGVSSAAISNEEAGLARAGQEAITGDLQEVSCTGGRTLENVTNVGGKMVRLRTDMGDPNRLRD